MQLNIKKTRVGSGFYDVEYVGELVGDTGNTLSGRIWQSQHLIRVLNTEISEPTSDFTSRMCPRYVLGICRKSIGR